MAKDLRKQRSHCALIFRTALLLALIAVTKPLAGQSREARIVAEIKSAYEQLDHQEAEIKAGAALRDYQAFSPAQLTEIHETLALIAFSRNETARAREEFVLALALTPSLELDPLYISPKILEFFQKVKAEVQSQDPEMAEKGPEVRYVVLQDRRAGAAWRGLILPGWGQRFKQEKTKGMVFTAIWVGGVAGTSLAHLARNDARDKYRAETDPADIENRYKTYNRSHKLRNNLAAATAAVWLASYLDAILRRRDAPTGKQAQSRWQVTPKIGLEVGAQLQVHF